VYIHNAFESWNQEVDKNKFFEMLSKVFEIYEKCRSENKIRYYGMATWTCFRVNEENKEYLSLEEIHNIAKNIGGKNHGFRFIQLPYNLAYSEALFLRNQKVGNEQKLSILEAAKNSFIPRKIITSKDSRVFRRINRSKYETNTDITIYSFFNSSFNRSEKN
jgi:aryl-alcohol dehydrogenase-like predicted oxidoreductase